MPVNDPIADMLTRMRNALAVRHESVTLPNSKAKVAVVRVLKEEGFIKDFEVAKAAPQAKLVIRLSYKENKEPIIRGLKRISRPGLRVYVGKGEIPRVYGGVGIGILSTSQGVVTSREAWRRGLGGELICHVW